MLQTTVVAVGKVRDRHLAALADDYRTRAARLAPIDVVEVRDARGDPTAEGVRLLEKLPAGAVVVLLDERGESRSSEQLASWLTELADRGVRDLRLVVGGPYGFAPAVRARADRLLSLSAMTLPHELARVVLLEQLYRAWSIVRGLPYHHAD